MLIQFYKQRWYVLGLVEETDGVHETPKNEPRLYALDRVKHMELTDRKFRRPKNFDPQAYFSGFYGVFCGKQYKPELIRAKLEQLAAKYMRSLPLHHSQREVEPCVFEWYIAPTLDFIQQLRTFGSELEILKPKSLREQFCQETKVMARKYKIIEN